MGQRVAFATTNWKNKPDKPDCLSQAEWDAINSSKFNGLPFASSVEKNFIDVKGSIDPILTDLQNQWDAVPLTPDQQGYSYTFGNQMREIAQNFTDTFSSSTYIEAPLSCENLGYQLWNGNYYEYNRTIQRAEQAAKVLRPDSEDPLPTYRDWLAQSHVLFKIPSNSTTEITQVCGPGTSAIEIDKDLAVDLVWRLKELELGPSTLSMTLNSDGQTDGSYVSDTFSSSLTFTTDVKTDGVASSDPVNESEIINETWAPSPGDKFIGDLTNNPDYGGYCQDTINLQSENISFQGSASIIVHDEDNQDGYCAEVLHPLNAFEIKLLPFSERQKAIISIQDGSQTRYFLDFRYLISFVSGNLQFQNFLNFGYVDSNIGIPQKGQTIQNIYIKFGGNISNSGHSPAAQRNYCAFYPQEYGVNRFDLHVDLMGRNLTVPVSMLYTKGCGGYYSQTTITGGTLKIKAKSYYEYATSNGEPVYDQSTGDQLRDPLS